MKKQIAIQKCNKDDEDAVAFCRKSSNWKKGVRYNNRETQQIIAKLTGWDLENFTYRVNGFFDDENGVMIFDLNDAKKFKRRLRKSS